MRSTARSQDLGQLHFEFPEAMSAPVLRLAGGLILIAMGIKIFFTHPAGKTPEASGHGLVASFGSSFFLMLTNPLAILVFNSHILRFGIGGGRTLTFPPECW